MYTVAWGWPTSNMALLQATNLGLGVCPADNGGFSLAVGLGAKAPAASCFAVLLLRLESDISMNFFVLVHSMSNPT